MKKKKKKFFWTKLKIMICYFTETEKDRPGNELKIIHYVQTWPPDVKNELFFQKKAIFSTKNAQFEKF